MPTPAIWTDDRVEVLRRLWAEGKSASEIARTLACGASRNAVIGKVYRLGLSGRSVEARRRPPRALPDTPARQRRPRRVIAGRPTDPGPALLCDESEPAQGSASILTIGAHACRWPYGDPLSEGFALCGQPAARGAYCGPHAERAYGPLGHKPGRDHLVRLAELR
ncbi:GcrA family cell cycle regulator [Phenylobacterium sp.]|jgi:GcrA cell cycle regulator|uniref:GcrA family cell cycle regulator n=1 Tax=Phenylobacterium sp. TaxID=1871053 RepID=UPI002E32BD24|nr:GcrA family cell cycle regulator [Phenylobacterium sp.]HEX4708966.1 GcrA family cell cycle regulator [Phenylobacterium sp.]